MKDTSRVEADPASLGPAFPGEVAGGAAGGGTRIGPQAEAFLRYFRAPAARIGSRLILSGWVLDPPDQAASDIAGSGPAAGPFQMR